MREMERKERRDGMWSFSPHSLVFATGIRKGCSLGYRFNFKLLRLFSHSELIFVEASKLSELSEEVQQVTLGAGIAAKKWTDWRSEREKRRERKLFSFTTKWSIEARSFFSTISSSFPSPNFSPSLSFLTFLSLISLSPNLSFLTSFIFGRTFHRREKQTRLVQKLSTFLPPFLPSSSLYLSRLVYGLVHVG